jgi:hypothetical protein
MYERAATRFAANASNVGISSTGSSLKIHTGRLEETLQQGTGTRQEEQDVKKGTHPALSSLGKGTVKRTNLISG